MSGYRERSIYYAEGFGYTTAELRKIYPQGTAATTVTMDTTTVPGRNFVRIPPNQYLDINFPKYTSDSQYTATFNDANVVWVIQGKVYFDAASYTNLTANRFLFEMASTDNGFTGFGISPNTVAVQDNWYIKFSDSGTDYATNVVAGALPVQTVKDVKLILRVVGGNDPQAWVYIDDVLVAYTSSTVGLNEADNMNDNFKGIRIWGLAEQTGDTLWGDLIAYRANHILSETLPALGNSPASTIGPGTSLLNKGVRVLDLTPDTVAGGINDFDVVGTGDPITALSSMDSSTYVASSDYGQQFMLKPKLPEGYNESFDGSTLAPYDYDTPVHGFNYMTWTKDLNLTGNNVRVLVRDDATAYRFRYYRLHLSGSMSRTDGTLNRITFVDFNLSPMVLPGSPTVRLNRIIGTVDASVPETAGATNNTTTHTLLLTGTSINFYNTVLNFTGLDIRNDGYIAEYLIDFGESNIAPNWYAIAINQTGLSSAIYNQIVVQGSTDGLRWYHLAENHFDTNAGTSATSYVLNRRHPEYASTQFRQRAQTPDFVPNGAQFEPLQAVAGGDVIAARANLPSDRGNTRTPIPLGQFKDYKIGVQVVEPYAVLTITDDETPYVSFAYDNFASTTDLNLINAYVDGSNRVVLTHFGGDWGNVARTAKSAYNRNWSMSWRMDNNGNAWPGFSINWTDDYNNASTINFADVDNWADGGKIDGSRHSIVFLGFTNVLVSNPLRWAQADGTYNAYPVPDTIFFGTKYYWMDYDHSDSTLAIYVSSTSTKPASPLQTLANFYFNSSELYNVAFGSWSYFADTINSIALANWSLVFKNTDGLVTDGLVLFLDAGDSYSYEGGTAWTDLSGYGHNATLVNGPTYTSASGGGITFDGVDDYVTVTETAAMTPQILTFEVTFKINGTVNTVGGTAPNTVQTIAHRQNNRTQQYEGYTIHYFEDTKRVGIIASTDAGTQYGFTNTTDINLGDICTITAVFDNTMMYVYRDGVLENSTAKAAGINYRGDHTLKLGKAVPVGTSFDSAMNGDIYNVKMYDRALTASEVLQNYNAYASRYYIVENGLVLNLDANNTVSYPGSGTTWYDLSDSASHFTLVGVDYISGPPAHFSFLNSQLDRIIRDDPVFFDGSPDAITSEFTTSVWIRFDNSTGQRQIFSYASSVVANEYWFNLESSTTATVRINDQVHTFSFTPVVGAWYNLVNVIDNSTVYLYVNGLLSSSVARVTPNYSLRQNGYFVMGQDQDSEGGSFDITQDLIGDIASVQIYNRPLTSSEVLQNFNATRARYGL